MKVSRVILVIVLFLCLFRISNSQDNSEFSPVVIETGQTPSCCQFQERMDIGIDNFLKIDVGGGADVVLKLINQSTDKCIRYVFIGKDDTYFMRNIPAGVYYVKIAFGNNWGESKQQSGCTAKFIDSNNFQIGNDLLDFNPVSNSEGIQIPSYELILKTHSNNRMNEFDAVDISEQEFNK